VGTHVSSISLLPPARPQATQVGPLSIATVKPPVCTTEPFFILTSYPSTSLNMTDLAGRVLLHCPHTLWICPKSCTPPYCDGDTKQGTLQPANPPSHPPPAHTPAPALTPPPGFEHVVILCQQLPLFACKNTVTLANFKVANKNKHSKASSLSLMVQANHSCLILPWIGSDNHAESWH
jgi:hypothetical protein